MGKGGADRAGAEKLVGLVWASNSVKLYWDGGASSGGGRFAGNTSGRVFFSFFFPFPSCWPTLTCTLWITDSPAQGLGWELVRYASPLFPWWDCAAGRGGAGRAALGT